MSNKQSQDSLCLSTLLMPCSYIFTASYIKYVKIKHSSSSHKPFFINPMGTAEENMKAFWYFYVTTLAALETLLSYETSPTNTLDLQRGRGSEGLLFIFLFFYFFLSVFGSCNFYRGFRSVRNKFILFCSLFLFFLF